jgi:hypothetical protein
MGTDKSRGAAKKSRSTALGRRSATIFAGTRKSTFTVHEEILCSRSEFFKARLQRDRKPIEDKCAVCQEDFDCEKDNISFCKSCGQNIHYACIDQWLCRKGKKRCPFCRAAWICESKIQISKCPDLDSDGFDVYVKYIYGKALPTFKAGSDDMDEHLLVLIKAWTVGDKLSDQDFKDAIIKQMGSDISDQDHLPGLTPMKFLYKDAKKSSWLLRSFFADAYALMHKYYKVSWYDDLDQPWAMAFLRDLTWHLLKARECEEEDRDMSDIVSTHTFQQDKGRLVDDDEDDEKV